MLPFLMGVFRCLFVVFLWLNLIGSVVAGVMLGIKGGGGWTVVGLIVGLIVGLLTDVMLGGVVATILCIEDKIDVFEDKYTKSLKLLETNSGILKRIDNKIDEFEYKHTKLLKLLEANSGNLGSIEREKTSVSEKG